MPGPLKKFLVNIIGEIKLNIKKSLDQLKNNSEEDKEINKKKSKWLLEMEEKLSNRIHNPRKVKRYLNNIEKMIFTADSVWFKNDEFLTNDFSKETWIEYIIQISVLKAFFQETYVKMINSGSFYYFRKDEKNSFIVEQIIKDFNSSYFALDNNNEIIEKIVYQLHILNVNIHKSQHQRVLEQIKSGQLEEKNILLYLQECMFYKVDFDILNNVLDYIEEGNIKRKEYIYQILEKMLEYFTEGEYNSRELKLYISIKRVRELIDIYSLEYKFSKEQINKIQYYIDKLQKELIFKNLSNIKILLEIFYKDYVDLSGNEKDKIWEKIMV